MLFRISSSVSSSHYSKLKYDNAFTASDGIPNGVSTRAPTSPGTARASWLFNWGGAVVARY
jgi:hypothetical protein